MRGIDDPLVPDGQMWVLPPEPPEFGIRFTEQAREKLVATGVVWDPFNDCPPDADQWRALEECLTELLAPPIRFITGMEPQQVDTYPATHPGADTATDRCQGCGFNARHNGDYLCSSCRVAGDPS